MILGQLIQTGRHFCECRSNDFIPKSEDTVVAIAYTIHDTFLAHSFDTDLPDLKGEIKTWLFQTEAVGYLLIRRKPRDQQRELPSPVGRIPMDQVFLTAATLHGFQLASYFLEEVQDLDSYRLVPTSCQLSQADECRQNLFNFPRATGEEDTRAPFLAFEEFAS